MSKFQIELKKVIIAISILATALLICSCRTGQKTDEASIAGSTRIYMFIGSYAAAEDPGLHVYSYDQESGSLKEIQQISGHPNPSFLAVHPSGKFLYAVNEIGNFMDRREGSVTSFIINKGELEYLNIQSSMGASPCHITILPDGSHVLVANYSAGNITALPVSHDGALEKATRVIQHEGSGPDQRRQRGPHAHSIYPSSDGSWIFAADLGTDKVMIYRNRGEDNLLIPNPASPYAKMVPGAGPRHLAFHPGGRWIYVINELNSTVTRLDFDDASGQVSVLESVTTLPAGWDDANFCADIHVHPGGKFLYASNRGHNSIAIFRIESDGRIVPAGHEPVRGDWPRNFSIDPAGKRLFVANQNSANITIFNIDQNSGDLTYTGEELKIDRPVCIKFLAL